MENNFNSFDNLETSIRKSSVIQERINLVSTHMYKQFLEYQRSTMNAQETFVKITDNMQATVEYLKQSFGARGVATDNIYYEEDASKSVLILHILWHTISFTTRWNNQPQALYRGVEAPMISGRIIAMKGDFNEITKNVKDENQLQAVLEQEVASLFIPAERSQNCIIKINHLGNREFYINHMDAPREFLLKVIETICGGGIYHEEQRQQ
ncbi:MAG: hypothetical protein KHX03_04285 [Clostridium sp.]|nr:hypothetical protein [Clostridium sp.]